MPSKADLQQFLHRQASAPLGHTHDDAGRLQLCYDFLQFRDLPQAGGWELHRFRLAQVAENVVAQFAGAP